MAVSGLSHYAKECTHIVNERVWMEQDISGVRRRNLYYTGIADAFRKAISADAYKEIAVEDIILSKEDIYYEQLVRDIKTSSVRVITITSPQQSVHEACVHGQGRGLDLP